MRVLLLRRAAFVAVLVTGLALCLSALHGVSGMDSSLQLAASTSVRPTFAADRQPQRDCPDHHRDRGDRRVV
jgi:hypothetical protein